MESLQGDFAQYYNQRKARQGAFWAGRYHATGIEDAAHLWRCLIYIELNMVRAGVVAHPSQWRWCSFNELCGVRQRYRLVDRGHFLRAMGADPAASGFLDSYRHRIEQRLTERALHRERVWTESLAVGSEAYVRRMAELVTNRYAVTLEPTGDPVETIWTLREEPLKYA